MKQLFIPGGDITPEILFNPDSWQLAIRGRSAPENAREIYLPAVEWLNSLLNKVLSGHNIPDQISPTLTVSLDYFNSTSAKFIYDIFMLLGKLQKHIKEVSVIWVFDPDDIDMKEAGEELASMAGLSLELKEKGEHS